MGFTQNRLHERQTSPLIGDNGNAASRLEGQTAFKKSGHLLGIIKQDFEKNVPEAKMRFVEIDTGGEGKNEGQKIYWPLPRTDINPSADPLDASRGTAMYRG